MPFYNFSECQLRNVFCFSDLDDDQIKELVLQDIIQRGLISEEEAKSPEKFDIINQEFCSKLTIHYKKARDFAKTFALSAADAIYHVSILQFNENNLYKLMKERKPLFDEEESKTIEALSERR